MDDSAYHWPRSGDDALSEPDCRRLLGTRSLGRVAITSGALPAIVPVEYVYENGCITFRTERDAKLRAASEGDVLAFEVDAYDTVSGRGWSVLVLGRATVIADDCGIAPVPSLDAGASANPRHHYYVRLQCEIVSGRRLASTE